MWLRSVFGLIPRLRAIISLLAPVVISSNTSSSAAPPPSVMAIVSSSSARVVRNLSSVGSEIV